MFPLQPEREERADARKFRVPLHSPIPISTSHSPGNRHPREIPGKHGGFPRIGEAPAELHGRPTLEVAGWRRYRWLKPSWQMRSGDKRLGCRGTFTLPLLSNSACGWGFLVGFFFFGFGFKKISQLLVHIWVPWFRQDADRKHTWSS